MKIYAIWTQSHEDIYGYETPMYLYLRDAEAKMKEMMDDSIAKGNKQFKEWHNGFANSEFNIEIEEIDVYEGEQLTI